MSPQGCLFVAVLACFLQNVVLEGSAKPQTEIQKSRGGSFELIKSDDGITVKINFTPPNNISTPAVVNTVDPTTPAASNVPTARPSIHEGEIRNNFGTKENSAQTCSDFLTNDLAYYIYPQNPFKVQCNNLKKSSCLPINSDPPDTDEIISSSIVFKNKEFWLSENGFHSENLTNNLDTDQISYLQSKSEAVSQTIRIYSLNTAVVPENLEKSMQLLLRTDRLVGPRVTDNIPMKYTVETCEVPADLSTVEAIWTCTDVTLECNANNRLPVTDAYIRDIRPGIKQKISLRLQKLCFYKTRINLSSTTSEEAAMPDSALGETLTPPVGPTVPDSTSVRTPESSPVDSTVPDSSLVGTPGSPTEITPIAEPTPATPA